MPRIYTLDTFRFFAASFVVLRHYNSDFRLGLENWIERIGNLDLFVDFFFILSGFVISLTYFEKINCWSDYRKFIGKRLARIYPLHFVTLFFVAGLAIIAGLTGNVINNPEVYQWKAFVPNLLLVHAWGTLKNSSFNVPSWSLSAEWFVYLLFPLFVALARRLPAVINFVLIGLFVISFQSSGLLPIGSHWTHADADFGNLRAVPTFFAGVICAAWFLRWPKSLPAWIDSWAMAFGLAAAVPALIVFGGPDELVILICLSVIFLSARLEASGSPSFLSRPKFRVLGNASYALYLLHRVVHIPVVVVAKKFALLGTMSGAALALATYFAVVALAVFSFYRFEQPVQHWLLGKSRQQGHARAAL